MSITDSQRYREAILMAAVADDGLEELILRLVEDDYPEAYLTGSGQDAGVDVLSDLGDPPERGWQAKNHFDTSIDWGKCRKSLASAMAGPKPPHYTFVFPRKLKKGELKHWLEEFRPAELARYKALLKLDFEDDLALQLKDHPEIVDEMSGGALSEYMAPLIAAMTKTGANPLAPRSQPKPAAAAASELGTEMAEKAREIGRRDGRFAYGLGGREAGKADEEIPDRVARFEMSHRRGELPSYSLAMREGDSVIEISAQPRDGVEIEAPEIWFAPNEEGIRARMEARNSLAKGRPIELSGEAVGVKPAELPEHFAERLDADGILRNGTVGLGLSELVPLQITLTIDGEELRQVFALYRVPPLRDGSIAYGGVLGGCAIFLDIDPVKGANFGPGVKADELNLSLTLAVAGETGAEAIRGLGFARAFTQAERLRFDAPELLPEEGLEIGRGDGKAENEETWEAAAVVAAALDALEKRDGKRRVMPDTVSLRDRMAAQMVFQVLSDGGIEAKTEGEFELPVPIAAVDGKKLNELLKLRVELPPIAGMKTGAFAIEELKDIEVLEALNGKGEMARLRCRSAAGGGRIVLRLERPEREG
jgi:hypothetical protein